MGGCRHPGGCECQACVGPCHGCSADRWGLLLRRSVLRSGWYWPCPAVLRSRGAAVDSITGQSAATARPAGTGLLSAFVPPLSCGDMTSAVSPGTMCPAHGSGNGKTAKTVANIGLDNPALKELLEGQAFYAALAPSQYDIPTTSTTAATQTANAKKQKMCAEHITDMMKLSKVAANTPGTGAAGTISTFANSYSAVEFPLWKVAVGASDSAVYTVPSGYCYANACFDD